MRSWLALTGLNPSTDWLDRFFSELIGAKADAQPLLELDITQIRRFADKAYIAQPVEAPDARSFARIKTRQQLTTGVGQFLLNSDNKGTPVLITDNPLFLVFGLFPFAFKPAGERQSERG